MYISIIGMYDYDPSIFDGLTVPTGINKTDVINEICLQCGELEIVYPNFNTMKLAIDIWSKSNAYTWDKLYKTMNLTYNPIWNVDANESETLNHGKSHQTSYDSTIETSYDSDIETTYDSTEERTLDTTDTESVKGFNSSSWSEANKMEHDGTDTLDHTGSDTVARSGKDTVDHSGKDTISETINDHITKTRTGNIGVTTTQKMISEEREIAEFSIINYIAVSFKERFCILVY